MARPRRATLEEATETAAAAAEEKASEPEKSKRVSLDEIADQLVEIRGDLARIAVALGQQFGEPLKSKLADVVLYHQGKTG